MGSLGAVWLLFGQLAGRQSIWLEAILFRGFQISEEAGFGLFVERGKVITAVCLGERIYCYCILTMHVISKNKYIYIFKLLLGYI